MAAFSLVGVWRPGSALPYPYPMAPSDRTSVRRLPEKGVYDHDAIAAILDEALFCHVGFETDGSPFVIPTIHARLGDILYVHGSAGSRMLKTLRRGGEICVTVTILDGLVLARSVFEHSMNYRSVVVLGTPREVTDPDEKLAALEAISDHVAPGRWRDARGPTETELAKTRVIALPLDEASAKVSEGPPEDEEADYDLDCWAGELPLRIVPGDLVADPRLKPGVEAPEDLVGYARSGQGFRRKG